MATSISFDGSDGAANLSSSCCGLGNCPGNIPCTGVSVRSTPPCRQKATKSFTSTTPDALQAPDA
eukprot:4818920-Amphidinium_carterae.1